MRILVAVGLSPIIIISVFMNGFRFFIMYATQWGILTTILSLATIWYTAKLEMRFELVSQHQNQSQDISKMNPNQFTKFQISSHEKKMKFWQRSACII